MKNTLENKAKFFAQYLGQRVLLWHEHSPFFNLLVEDFKSDTFSNYLLQLTPLSQITDEDRYWLCSQMAYRIDESNFKKISDAAINHLLDFNKWSGSTILYIIDYLRSKGYALPWMGLSVEQLVSFGWVKLTS